MWTEKAKKNEILVLFILCSLLLSGCSVNVITDTAKNDTTEAAQTEEVPSGEAQTGEAASTQAGEAAVPKESTQAAGITEEDVFAAALAHAGLEEGDVTAKHIERDYENGKEVYEVEFHAGGREYDYEIDAAAGDILNWEAEKED